MADSFIGILCIPVGQNCTPRLIFSCTFCWESTFTMKSAAEGICCHTPISAEATAGFGSSAEKNITPLDSSVSDALIGPRRNSCEADRCKMQINIIIMQVRTDVFLS